MARYGLLPQPSDPKYNPDGLPIGVSKTVVNDGRWKGEWVGLGCAACHNGQLEYKGTKIRISGGNANTLDILGFIQGLDDALAATVADPEKFTRLAEKLGKNDDAGKEGLRRRLQQDAEAINRYRSRTALTPIVVGPGRMDALGLIHNQVQSNTMGVPENWRAALAPVKPSFCWNVPQSAWAQWSGVLKDPILRNLGEVMGVFAKIDLTSKSPEDGLFEFNRRPQGSDGERGSATPACAPEMARRNSREDRSREGHKRTTAFRGKLRDVPLHLAAPLE